MKIGGQVITWSVTVFMMRLLAPEDYGLMAMVMVVLGLGSVVAELGLGASLVQARHAPREQQSRVFALSLLLNFGIYLSLLLLAPLAVLVFGEERLLSLLALAGMQLPLAALAVVPESMARRELRFRELSLIELGAQLGNSAVTVACGLAGYGVWALVLGQVAGTVTKCLLYIARFGLVSPLFGLTGQGALIRFGITLTATRLVWYLYSQADVFIAGKVLGSHLLGIYSVAVNLASMPMQKIMGIVNQIAFSALARLAHDTSAFDAALLRSVALIVWVSVAPLWGLAAIAPEAVPLLLGLKWSDAVFPLQIVSVIVPIRVASAMLSTALLAAGHVGMDLRNTLTSASLLIPAFVVGSVVGGVSGLALAWAIVFPVVALLLARRATAALEVKLFPLCAVMVKPMSAGVAMVAAVLAARWLFGTLPVPVLLLVEVLAGACAYLSCMFWLDRAILRDLLDLLKAGGPHPPN